MKLSRKYLKLEIFRLT